MNVMHKASLSVAMLLVGFSIGCGKCGTAPSAADGGSETGQAVTASIPAGRAHTHTHDGWWCDEHGVPEEICGQCSPKVAAACQKKGDWCQDHDRPDSQCFLCHPELETRFAEKYEAKFGKKPPQPEG